MNRFPIWKGKRIGRYDDRLILRSVIFFSLTVAALSVFTIWMTERNILLRIFLLFLITVLCLLDLFYKWKSGSMVDIRNRQAMSRMLLENRWFETEPLQRYRSGGRMERITYFPALYYRRKNRHIYVTVKITMGKYQDKLLHLEEKLETGLNCKKRYKGYLGQIGIFNRSGKEPDRYSGCKSRKWRTESDAAYLMEI